MSSDVPGGADGPDDDAGGPDRSEGSGAGGRPMRSDGGRVPGRDPLEEPADGDRRGARPDRGGAGGLPREGRRDASRPAVDETCPVTGALRAAGVLDSLAHVGPARSGRFGTERRVRRTPAAGSHRLDVRVFREPSGDEDGFEEALERQLHRWATAGDVDGVVPVVDRGTADRPWVATASTGPTLRGRDTPSVTRALRQATHLSAALVALHERGVVHAGIDPDNVAFTLAGEDPPRPAFHNPGLVDVYRRYEDPASVLDPRYAAPEYFSSDRGVVDRATDVYGLGVICFRLFTGVAPVEGSAEAIAERVTTDDPLPRPSRVEPRLPEVLDDVVLRATATDKFDRFDTARAFHEALVAVRDGGVE